MSEDVATMTSGCVEEARAGGLRGWISAREGDDRKITLRLNGRVITSTSAMVPAENGATDAYEFFFTIDDLWRYVSSSDILSVHSATAQLALAQGLTLTSFGSGEFPADKLFTSLQDGHVFNKKGKLQLSKLLNKPWQDGVLTLFRSVRESLQATHGYDLYPCYGTLLGAVRGGDFIGHDDDFDTAYISRGETPRAVRDELLELANTLIERGYRVRPGFRCLKVGRPDLGKAAIDIFQSYFDGDGIYRVPFGHAGTDPYRREHLTGWTTAQLGAETIAVPANPDRLLAWLYGPHWRTPNPNFNWRRERKGKVSAAYPSHDERAAIYWDDRYAHKPLGQASRFQALAASRLRAGMFVIDLGCGSGRDSLAFGRHPDAARVFGADRSRQGIAAATRLAGEAQLNTTFSVVDLAKRDHAGRLLQDARHSLGEERGRGLIYLRHLLDSTPPAAQTTMIAAIIDAVGPGDVLAIEERQYSSTLSEKMLAKSFRWRVDMDHLRCLVGSRSRLTILDKTIYRVINQDVTAINRLIVHF